MHQSILSYDLWYVSGERKEMIMYDALKDKDVENNT